MLNKPLGSVLICLFLGYACAGKKKTEQASIVELSAEPFCTISFFSIGYGIDVQGLKSVQLWSEQKKDSVVLLQTPWGREGEVDLCFQSKFKEDHTHRWLKELKAILGSAKNCRISLEKQCRK
jgi:hypothetical protein